MQYEREKHKERGGGDRRSIQAENQKGQNVPNDPPAQKLATQYKVAERTIKRDAKYARAVNAVDKAAGNGANV